MNNVVYSLILRPAYARGFLSQSPLTHAVLFKFDLGGRQDNLKDCNYFIWIPKWS